MTPAERAHELAGLCRGWAWCAQAFAEEITSGDIAATRELYIDVSRQVLAIDALHRVVERQLSIDLGERERALQLVGGGA